MFSAPIRAVAVAASMMLGAAAAQATPTTALYLAMDGSGSISGTDFTTQVTAYNQALTTFFNNNPGAYGAVAIGGLVFGADYHQFFALTDIANATVLGQLETAIMGLNPSRGGIDTGATNIGLAISTGATALQAYNTSVGGGLKMLIDVTTDGQWNMGTNPATVAASVVPPLAAVNCLGIGTAADCTFVTGHGTNYGQVSYAGLEAALTHKITTETIPEPATMLMLGVGIAALGQVRRRRA